MWFVEFLFLCVGLVVAGLSFYLMVIVIGSFFFKRRSDPTQPPLRIVVFVPAYNEELGIAGTIESLQKSYYPEALREIIVIADNCTDGTASVARDLGVRVLERVNLDERGKGYAIDWALGELRDELVHVDVVAMVDADSWVDPFFLSQISSSFALADVDAVQGYYGVRNAGVNWRTGLSELAIALVHHVRPAGRNFIASTCGLKGSGMAFRAKCLVEMGWKAHSLVEDMEYTYLLLERGIVVHFNPLAVIKAVMAVTKEEASPQRARWEGGRLLLIKKYSTWLISRFNEGRDWRFLEALLDLVFPPISLWVMGNGVLLIMALLIFPSISVIFACSLVLSLVYLLAGIIEKRLSLRTLKSLCCLPLFLIWRLPVFCKLLVTKVSKMSWVRTPRAGD